MVRGTHGGEGEVPGVPTSRPGSLFQTQSPLGEPGALGGSQLNPVLKEGRAWDRHSQPTWPGGGSLASVVPVAEGLGHGQQSRCRPGSPLPRALGTAALVRSPGQAEAEEPGSMEKSQPGGQSPEAGDQPWAQLLQSQAGEGWLWTWG